MSFLNGLKFKMYYTEWWSFLISISFFFQEEAHQNYKKAKKPTLPFHLEKGENIAKNFYSNLYRNILNTA